MPAPQGGLIFDSSVLCDGSGLQEQQQGQAADVEVAAHYCDTEHPPLLPRHLRLRLFARCSGCGSQAWRRVFGVENALYTKGELEHSFCALLGTRVTGPLVQRIWFGASELSGVTSDEISCNTLLLSFLMLSDTDVNDILALVVECMSDGSSSISRPQLCRFLSLLQIRDQRFAQQLVLQALPARSGQLTLKELQAAPLTQRVLEALTTISLRVRDAVKLRCTSLGPGTEFRVVCPCCGTSVVAEKEDWFNTATQAQDALSSLEHVTPPDALQPQPPPREPDPRSCEAGEGQLEMLASERRKCRPALEQKLCGWSETSAVWTLILTFIPARLSLVYGRSLARLSLVCRGWRVLIAMPLAQCLSELEPVQSIWQLEPAATSPVYSVAAELYLLSNTTNENNLVGVEPPEANRPQARSFHKARARQIKHPPPAPQPAFKSAEDEASRARAEQEKQVEELRERAWKAAEEEASGGRAEQDTQFSVVQTPAVSAAEPQDQSTTSPTQSRQPVSASDQPEMLALHNSQAWVRLDDKSPAMLQALRLERHVRS